jgi:hypothetical protein
MGAIQCGVETVLPAPQPTYIYHITHIRNLPSILARGGLLACGDLRRLDVGYTDIAHQHIQDRRAAKRVLRGPGGVLHDYVPFYFAPRSPMLFAISKGRVEGYDEGQEPVIYLVTTTQHIQMLALPFVFTDGHGTMDVTKYFDHLDDLGRVDWNIMRARYWHDTDEHLDRKRRRQAEFLIHRAVPWGAILCLGVMSAPMQAQVQALIRAEAHRPPVRIHRDWYY